MRILLIEDDVVLSDILLQSLTQQHYAVDLIDDGQMGWEYAQSAEYDLIVMDIGLPKLDGISLCQQLRSQGYAKPILLITAKDAASDRIKGLDAGADDYLIKPFNLGELEARVRALLRRGEVVPSPILEIAGLKLDPSRGEVFYHDRLLKLTPKEYGLLELFLRNPTRLFNRGQIMEHLWTFDDFPSEDSVKAHIKGLRQKLKQAGAADWIENVYGMGYRLNPQVSDRQVTATPNSPAPSPDSTAQSAPPSPIQPSSIQSSPIEQKFQQAVAGLWQQHQGLMMQRMETLQQAAIALQTDNLPSDLRQAAAQAAHKLAGVLGMFGKDDGTTLARAIEQLLTDETSDNSAFLGLLQQLDELLALPRSVAQASADVSSGQQAVPHSLTATSSVTYSSLKQIVSIGLEPSLEAAIQPFTASLSEFQWQSFQTIEQAKSWLQNHSTDLLLLHLNLFNWQRSLTLIHELASRIPPIPSIALTHTLELADRVAIAQAGGQRILHQSVTAVEIWEAITQLLQQRVAQQVNILAVDDDPIFLSALPPLLEPWGIRVTGLSNPAECWKLLETIAPDLLILDVEMPNFDGIELCRAVRTETRWQELPIVFVTARCDRQTIQEIFAAGADDYITKPLVGSELVARITNRLERTRLLQVLATREPTTGLMNQIHSQRMLGDFFQNANQHQDKLSLVILKVTNLDTVNLNYGHVIGNQVLQQWGHILRSHLRNVQILSYWGNGEFAIAVPELGKTEAQTYLEELLTRLRQQIFTNAEGDRFQIAFSYCIAEYPCDGTTLHTLYQQLALSTMGTMTSTCE